MSRIAEIQSSAESFEVSLSLAAESITNSMAAIRDFVDSFMRAVNACDDPATRAKLSAMLDRASIESIKTNFRDASFCLTSANGDMAKLTDLLVQTIKEIDGLP